MESDDGWEREHGVVWVDVGGFSCGLLDSFHFFLATCVVDRADDD